MRKILAAAAVLAFALGAAPANAATLTPTSVSLTNPVDIGFSWTVDFTCLAVVGCNGGNPGVTLAALAVTVRWNLFGAQL